MCHSKLCLYVYSNKITCRTTATFTTAGEGRVLLHNFPGSTPPSPAMQVLQHKVGSATLIIQNSIQIHSKSHHCMEVLHRIPFCSSPAALNSISTLPCAYGS